MADDETLIRSRTVRLPLSEIRVPMPGRKVKLYLDGRKLAEETTDARGVSRFDLRRYLSRGDAAEDHKLILKSANPEGGTWEIILPFPSDLARQVLGT